MIVLVPEALYGRLLSEARTLAPNVTLHPYSEDAETPVEGLDEAEGVLRWVGGNRFGELVANGPKVRWLHTASAGVDHVLRPAGVRDKSGLVLTDSGPAFEIAISEFVMAWILMVARRMPQLMESQRAHVWRSEIQDELYGATVGIIGLGPIGQGIAARAKAFGMRTVGLRRKPDPVAHIDEVWTGDDGLNRLLEASDYVVIAAAATDDTRALIGADQLAKMKPAAWLINIARGSLVDEPALIETLQAGRIAGACLDVFAQEPLPQDSPLWDLHNVHLAPHNSSGWSPGLRNRQKAIFLENLRRFAAGEPLENVVDIARGY
ncbi:hydroxyacid dehydrogenase [Capsulimonas corticalis]|uniref:Hydroxyacid dehydrogenase n=1 Tax=Capsulimonas corticalis TaxID=2219043 RepID=A0A402CWJ1_9BACT|nr:D-2-hydroxyacid dehydrogenase [Capsulimonas corticalis]BDI34200.1 hydroxyacid dehydrogenase [Capsulimonas corticalis]